MTVQGITQSNADLVVTVGPDPPADALPGDPLDRSRPSVKNQGSEDAPASTTSVLSREHEHGGQEEPQEPRTTNVATPCAPGGTSIDGPTVDDLSVYVGHRSPGTYILQACADGPKGVAEAIETNNCTNCRGDHHRATRRRTSWSASIGNPPATAPLGAGIKVTNSGEERRAGQAGASSTKYYLVSSTTDPGRT